MESEAALYQSFIEHLCLIEKLVDVAPNGIASQSSTSKWSKKDDPQRAVNGTVADFAFHTGKEVHPWWEIQFDRRYDVRYVVLHNRRNTKFQSVNRKINVEVYRDGGPLSIYVGDRPFGAEPDGMPLVLSCPTGGPIRGFRVTALSDTYLHLAGVNVLCKVNEKRENAQARSFVAMRSDGLGERLRAMLNAMVLARATGGDFIFTWSRKKTDLFHAVLDAPDMFDAEFLASHCVSVDVLRSVDIVNLKREAANIVKNTPPHPENMLVRVDHEIDYELRKRFFLREKYKEAFEGIRFSRNLEYARAMAQAVDLPVGTVALHLRAGDIVYGQFRFVGHFASKIYPYPLAIRLVEEQIAQGNRPLVFGQDAAFLEWLKETYDIQVVADLTGGMEFSAEQLALFEICLMSRCARIYAGASGFAILAAAISDQRIIPPTRFGTVREQVRSLEEVLVHGPVDPRISNLQRAMTAWSVIRLSEGTLPPERELFFANLALQYDPTNVLYSLHGASILYRSGDICGAEGMLLGQLTKSREAYVRFLARLLQPRAKGNGTATPYLSLLKEQAELGRPMAAFCVALSSLAQGDHGTAEQHTRLFKRGRTEGMAWLDAELDKRCHGQPQES